MIIAADLRSSSLELSSVSSTAFSAGLAVLNVVPSYLLDGQHIVRVLVEILLQRKSERTRLTVTAGLTLLGSLLISLNIILGLVSLSSNPPL